MLRNIKKSVKLAGVIMGMIIFAAVLPAAAALQESREGAGDIGSIPLAGEFDAALTVDLTGNEGERGLPDSNKLQSAYDMSGTIRIVLTNGSEGTSKSGVEITCEKVGDIQNGRYVLTDRYSDMDLDLNQLKNATELEQAARKISEAGSNITVSEGKAASDKHPDIYRGTTDSEGILYFDDLQKGIYLIQASSGEHYDEITPFLVSVPNWSEESGKMLYDIEVIPKHSPKQQPEAERKEAPQTGIDSPIARQLGCAGIILVTLLFIVCKEYIERKKEQQ